MSKISTLLVAGGGGTVAAVSGAYLIKNGLGRGEIPEVSLLFDSVEKFEQEWKTKPTCVTKLFAVGFDESAATSTTLPTTGDSTFFNTTTTDQTPYESCVIIDWKRDEYENNKWKDGKFTGTGTFVKGNEGFVNFNVAETIPSDTSKIKFTGVFYLLGKESASESKGKVKHKTEVKDESKKIGQNDLDSYFPKKGTGVTEAGIDSYGGFFKNSTTSGQRLQHICGTESDCTDANKKPTSSKRIELSGTGTQAPTGGGADSRKSIKDWNENLTGGDNIYGASTWSLKDKLVDEFKGDWSKVTTSNS